MKYREECSVCTQKIKGLYDFHITVFDQPLLFSLMQINRFWYNTARMSLNTSKPDFCLCKNKGADQLCSNCTADQRLCFHYMYSTIHLLLISELSSF